MPSYGGQAPYGDLQYKGQGGASGAFAANRINRTNGRCLRYAVKKDQGNGWSEYGTPTDGWLWPYPHFSPLIIVDDNDQRRIIVLDEVEGKFYEIAHRNGPAGSGIKIQFEDKINGSYAGTEIKGEVHLGEHVADRETKILEHLETSVFLRPYDPENANKAGHDSEGFRNAFAFDLEFYKDGELSFSSRTQENGRRDFLKSDQFVEARRLQQRIKFDTSEWRMVGISGKYNVQDTRGLPDERTASEDEWQAEFSLPVLWLSRGPTLNLDRASGVAMTGDAVSGTTGPDGMTASALSFALGEKLQRTISSLTGNFTITTFVRNVVGVGRILQLPTGSLNFRYVGEDKWRFTDSAGNNIGVRYNDTSGATWVHIAIVRSGSNLLWYQNGALLQTVNLASGVTTYGGLSSINNVNNGALDIYDFRIFASAISTKALAYYYSDVTGAHNGNSFLPIFG